jgi:hypothetical protein
MPLMKKLTERYSTDVCKELHNKVQIIISETVRGFSAAGLRCGLLSRVGCRLTQRPFPVNLEIPNWVGKFS